MYFLSTNIKYMLCNIYTSHTHVLSVLFLWRTLWVMPRLEDISDLRLGQKQKEGAFAPFWEIFGPGEPLTWVE